jgi:hypothetical protein
MKDELTQIAVLRTKYVIMGSDICRYKIKEYSSKTDENSTLKTLTDIIQLNQIPRVNYTYVCNVCFFLIVSLLLFTRV